MAYPADLTDPELTEWIVVFTGPSCIVDPVSGDIYMFSMPMRSLVILCRRQLITFVGISHSRIRYRRYSMTVSSLGELAMIPR